MEPNTKVNLEIMRSPVLADTIGLTAVTMKDKFLTDLDMEKVSTLILKKELCTKATGKTASDTAKEVLSTGMEASMKVPGKEA